MTESNQAQSIPEGYKQTEPGVIPDDWDVIQLGDCASYVGSGKTNTKSRGEYPLYGSTGLIGSCERPDYSGESLLVARVGANAGRLNYVCGEYGVSDNTILIKTKPDHSIDFFKYWLIRKNLNTLVFGSGQPLITGTQLKELALPLPSKTEQTAIANALSDVDALIGELEKLIAKKQAIKTATMQQLLTGKTRLPAFANHADGTPTNSSGTNLDASTGGPKGEVQDVPRNGYKSSELGEIPEDWEVFSFGDCLKIRHGKNQHDVENVNGEYSIFATGGEIGRASSYLYDKPSVLIGRKGTINKPRYAESPFWTVDTLFYSEISSSFNEKFVYYKFCMIDWMQYNEASGVPSLNASTIEGVRDSFPGVEEQTAIAKILSDMDSEIQTLEKRLHKTRQLKQGMMQELLTGKTRLVSS